MNKLKKGKFNIGFFVFIVIIIYIIFTIIFYFMNSSYDSFVVSHGTLEDFKVHTGIAVRQEINVKTKKTGKVHYLVNEADKVSFGGDICTFDDIENKFVKSNTLGSTNNKQEIESSLQNLQKSYNEQEREKVYEFLNKRLYNANEIDNEVLYDEIETQKAPKDGTISFHIDNIENLTVDKIDQKVFNEKKYSKKILRENTYLKKGDVLYKLVTSQDWHIVCNISSKEYNKIKNKKDTLVNLQFLKDGTKTSAKIRAKKIKRNYYAILDISDYMPRYISDRFLSVKIVYDGATGLKIPTSSITTKKFIVVPIDYIMDYNNTGYDYVIKKINKKHEHIQVDVYYMDKENNYAYIASDNINEGDTIYNEDDGELTLHKTSKLIGVYNTNKGYALFKKINILFRTKNFAIIEEGTSYGISNYDYIAADGEKAKKDEL